MGKSLWTSFAVDNSIRDASSEVYTINEAARGKLCYINRITDTYVSIAWVDNINDT